MNDSGFDSGKRAWLAVAAGMAAMVMGVGCGGGGGGSSTTMYPPGTPASGPTGTGSAYLATALVSDGSGTPNTDAHLVNGWGVAFNPKGFVWVANNGSASSTLYDGNGVPQSLVVATQPAPTGIVFNASTDFPVTQGSATGASAFIFAGEGGTLAGWAPSVNLNATVTVVDGGAAGKSYKGLALAAAATGNVLYAAEFHHGAIDQFDKSFAPIVAAGAFVDPNLPAGYAPFGIQAIGGSIYVAYAQQDGSATDAVKGAGLGLIDVYDTAGAFVKRLATGGALNAPWGMTLAPAGFGSAAGMLLVGNFGDGRINAYDPASGDWKGSLSKADGSAIVIDGLWGIAFGNGLSAQPLTTLFYAAGPDDEAHGVYGRIDPQ